MTFLKCNSFNISIRETIFHYNFLYPSFRQNKVSPRPLREIIHFGWELQREMIFGGPLKVGISGRGIKKFFRFLKTKMLNLGDERVSFLYDFREKTPNISISKTHGRDRSHQWENIRNVYILGITFGNNRKHTAIRHST